MALVDMFPHLCSHTRPKEVVVHQIEHPLRLRWPTSLLHLPRAFFLCINDRTSCNRASLDSFGRAFLYRTPCLSLRWLHLWRNCQGSGGSVILSRCWPRVLSCSLTITRPKTGSAWCQSSMVIASDLQTIPYWIQDVQITAICFNRASWIPWGWPPAWLALPLQWPRGGCLRYQACTLARIPSTRCLCQC